MKAAILGGGMGCAAFLKMILHDHTHVLDLEVVGVIDRDPNAPGMVFAQDLGIETFSHLEAALDISGLEVLIELVGKDSVLDQLYKSIPTGIKVIDHTMAKVFWDLSNVTDKLHHDQFVFLF